LLLVGLVYAGESAKVKSQKSKVKSQKSKVKSQKSKVRGNTRRPPQKAAATRCGSGETDPEELEHGEEGTLKGNQRDQRLRLACDSGFESISSGGDLMREVSRDIWSGEVGKVRGPGGVLRAEAR
jgi:hypothetical protein